MAKLEKSQSLYNFMNTEKNGINELGCRLLSNIDAICLQEINLNKNRIGDSGCKWLSRGKWMHIENIFLSKFITIKLIIGLDKKDVFISARLTGRISTKFILEIIPKVKQLRKNLIKSQTEVVSGFQGLLGQL